MFSRNAPRAERFEASSFSSVSTIVAKLGQLFSLSEKNVPPNALAMWTPCIVPVM